MKKAYCKPELYYESYELSSNIAGNCATGLPSVGEVNMSNYGDCRVDVGGGDFLFLAQGIGCNTAPSEGDGYCYQTFATDIMLFNS